MSGHDWESSVWFPSANRKSTAKIRLFCFPYAGGNSSLFSAWPEYFSDLVEVCPVNLPGRGIRFHEKAFTQLAPLARELATAIAPCLDIPFAFFGHSLGGLLAFELAHELRTAHRMMPFYLFVSGCRTPRRDVPKRTLHDLPEDEFLTEIKRIGGTPEDVLNNRELMSIMLPTLRADFSLWETYRCMRSEPLTCPIVAFGGLQDSRVSCEQLESWREETRGQFSLHLFPGDHFFLHAQTMPLLAMIARYLEPQVHRMALHMPLSAVRYRQDGAQDYDLF
ncbi:thioesterase II family protein [Methylobacter sp. sgz302048]|uniref:thioesterase II family protein n=1 Tax=Methylobacter sp. sgz302048 TaxID=3455945 RepID=UPI003FA00064